MVHTTPYPSTETKYARQKPASFVFYDIATVDLKPKDWFVGSAELDQQIRYRFGELLDAAAACELESWRISADGSLAEIIVLDQFSRNIYRSDPRAFRNDPLALALAQSAIAKGIETRKSACVNP